MGADLAEIRQGVLPAVVQEVEARRDCWLLWHIGSGCVRNGQKQKGKERHRGKTYSGASLHGSNIAQARGPNDLNREAEPKPPSRVAWSDLLAQLFRRQ